MGVSQAVPTIYKTVGGAYGSCVDFKPIREQCKPKKRANQVAAGLRYVHTGVHTYGSGTHQLQVFSLSPRMNSNTALENNNHQRAINPARFVPTRTAQN